MRKKLKYLSVESARMALEAWEERVKPDSLICIIQWRSVQEVTQPATGTNLDPFKSCSGKNWCVWSRKHGLQNPGMMTELHDFPPQTRGDAWQVLLMHQPPHPSAERAFLSLTEPWGSLMLPEHLLPSVCAHTGCQGPQCQNKCLACSSVTTALPSHSWLK